MHCKSTGLHIDPLVGVVLSESIEKPQLQSHRKVYIISEVSVEVARAEVIDAMEIIITKDEMITESTRYATAVMYPGVLWEEYGDIRFLE